MQIPAPQTIERAVKENGRITYHPVLPEGTMVDVNHLMTLREAVRLGYAKALGTLQQRAQHGRLKTIKPGRDWLTTHEWLTEAGYILK